MSHIRPGVLTLAFTASLLLWASIAVTPVRASLVTYNFEGNITETSLSLNNQNLNPPFFRFQAVTGSATYESTTPDSNPADTTIGRYNATNPSTGITALTVNFHADALPTSGVVYGATLGTGGSNFIQINTFGTTFQEERIQRAPINGTPVGGYSPLAFRTDIGSFDGNNGLSGSDALVLPTLGNINGSGLPAPTFRMIFDNDGQLRSFDGELTKLTLAPVPLPPAAILFGAGIVALVGLGARNWRQKEHSLA